MCWKEGITTAFYLGSLEPQLTRSIPAMRKHGGIRHILARHVEGASYMAEGYTRTVQRQVTLVSALALPARQART